jgi:hypothetical protein
LSLSFDPSTSSNASLDDSIHDVSPDAYEPIRESTPSNSQNTPIGTPQLGHHILDTAGCLLAFYLLEKFSLSTGSFNSNSLDSLPYIKKSRLLSLHTAKKGGIPMLDVYLCKRFMTRSEVV